MFFFSKEDCQKINGIRFCFNGTRGENLSRQSHVTRTGKNKQVKLKVTQFWNSNGKKLSSVKLRIRDVKPYLPRRDITKLNMIMKRNYNFTRDL